MMSDALAVAMTHGVELINGLNYKKPKSTNIFSRKSSSIAASINPDKIKL